MPRSRSKSLRAPSKTEAEVAKLRETAILLRQQKKKLEQELYESRFHLNTLLEINDTIHYLIYPRQPEKNFFSVRWEKLLGFSPRQTLDPLQEKKNLVLFSSLSQYEKNIEQLKKKQKVSFKYQYQNPKTNKILWLQEEILVRYDILADQEVWSGTITDISESEFFKEYIAESEKRFKNITDVLPIIIWVTDEEDNITYFNDKAAAFFKIKKGETLSLSDFGPAIDPAFKEKVFADWDRQKAGRVPMHIELLIRDRNGNNRFLVIEAIPRLLPGGQFIGYIAASYDLSKEYEYKQGMEQAFALLKSSEEKYRMLFQNMQLGVLEVDTQDKIRYANAAFSSICGYSIKELKGKKAGELFCGDKESEAILKKQQQIRKKGIESAYELRLKKKNGTLASVIISGAPLFDNAGRIKGSVGIHWDVTDVRAMERALVEARINKEKELIEAKLQTEEEQLVQIGRDLHDGVGQVLAYLSMQLGLFVLNDNINKTALTQLEKSARSALEQVRTLSRTLAPPALRDLGLRDAVKELIEGYGLIEKPVFVLDIYKQNEDYNLNMDKKIMVYRILQELLSNTFKHARANVIGIKLFFDAKRFHLEYSDDGIGFDTSRIKKGVGLESIRSRVAFYKGSVHIDALPGKGSKTIIQIPLS